MPTFRSQTKEVESGKKQSRGWMDRTRNAASAKPREESLERGAANGVHCYRATDKGEDRSLGGRGRLPFWPHLQSAAYFAVPCRCHYFTTSATTWAKVPAFFNILPFVMDTELLLAHSGSQWKWPLRTFFKRELSGRRAVS